MDDKNLNILLVGNSGNGKSAFVLSQMNDAASKILDITGDRQTTRTSMLYRINRSSDEQKVLITLKKKEQFREERIEALKAIIEDRSTKIGEEDRKKIILYDKAFFDCSEYGSKAEIEREYVNFINDNNWNAFVKLVKSSNSNGGDSEIGPIDGNEEAEKAFKVFYDKVYDICSEEIKKSYSEIFGEWKSNLQCVLLDLTSQDFDEKKKGKLAGFFKVVEDEDNNIEKKSYSSLVERIDVFWPASDDIKHILESNDLNSITLVDTYGINHEKGELSSDSEFMDKLSKRLDRLMNGFPKEHEGQMEIGEFQYALFIKKNIDSSDFAPELPYYIPALIEARSSVMTYAVITKSDELLDANSDNPRFNKASSVAWKSLTDSGSAIYKGDYKSEGIIKKLEKVMSGEMINARIKSMTDYVILFCGNFNTRALKKDPQAVDFLKNENKEGMKRLVFAMKHRVHLGSLYISKKLLENDRWESFLDVKDVLEKSHIGIIDKPDQKNKLDRVFYYGHWKTVDALKDRYQNRGELGFWPSPYSTDSRPIGIWINHGDKSILRQAFVKRIINGTVIENINKDVFTAVCQTMNHHLDSLFCCRTSYLDRMIVSSCRNCEYRDTCLSYKLYELVRDDIESINDHDLTSWKGVLDPAYVAKKMNDEVLGDIQNCIGKWFEDVVIPDILENYNTERLLTVLKDCEINGKPNENMLYSKIDEYMKAVYGEAADKEEVLALIKEKILPQLDDAWLNQ